MDEHSSPLLAVIAPTFNGPMQTFVRAHVRSIAPGRTVTLDWSNKHLERGGQVSGDRALTMEKPRTGLLKLLAGPHSAAERARAVRFLRAHRITTMLAEFGWTGIAAQPIAEEAGCRLFVHFHGADASRSLGRWRVRSDYRMLFKKAAGIIAPSRYILDRLIAVGCPQKLGHVVPCGVEPADFPPSIRLPNRLIAVGRLVEKKNPLVTIDAFAAIAARFGEARLDIIGDGPLKGACAERIERHGLGQRITLHGLQSHEAVGRMMGEASIFLQHSVMAPDGNTEGMPVSIMEAMSAGLAIVATRHAGIPECIGDGVEGLLVDEGDTDGMASAISDLLSLPLIAASMGSAARARLLAGLTQAHTTSRLRAVLGLVDKLDCQ